MYAFTYTVWIWHCSGGSGKVACFVFFCVWFCWTDPLFAFDQSQVRRSVLICNLRITEHSMGSVLLSSRTWIWRLCGTTTCPTCCPRHCRPMSWSAAPASPAATRSSRTRWGGRCLTDTPSKASPSTSCTAMLVEPLPPAWGEQSGEHVVTNAPGVNVMLAGVCSIWVSYSILNATLGLPDKRRLQVMSQRSVVPKTPTELYRMIICQYS